MSKLMEATANQIEMTKKIYHHLGLKTAEKRKIEDETNNTQNESSAAKKMNTNEDMEEDNLTSDSIEGTNAEPKKVRLNVENTVKGTNLNIVQVKQNEPMGSKRKIEGKGRNVTPRPNNNQQNSRS